MSIDYTKLNDQVVKQAYDASSAFLTEAQRQRLFQNKIDRAAAMIRAQEQFRRMEQEQWNNRGVEKLAFRQSHKLKVVGSNPTPATMQQWGGRVVQGKCLQSIQVVSSNLTLTSSISGKCYGSTAASKSAGRGSIPWPGAMFFRKKGGTYA